MFKKTVCLYIISIYILIISMSFASADLYYKEGELLVRFKPKANKVQRSVSERNQILSSHNTGSIKKSYKLVPGLTLVKLPANMEVTDALSKLRGKSEILYVEPNYKIQLLSTFPNETEPPGRFNEQWGLYNPPYRHDIHAPEAWDIIHDAEDIIVAVVDSGVSYAHPDIAANMWINEAEFYGQPDVDDDGNGFFDDIYGYDFCTADDGLTDSDPNDTYSYGHGTHVAGIIGAVGNNGEGIAGVCWNVKIMAVKAGNNSGGGLMCGYLINSRNNAKALFGFKPQAFAQAINSIISTRLLAVSQLCI